MARRAFVEVVGDAASAIAAFTKTEAAAAGLAKTLDDTAATATTVGADVGAAYDKMAVRAMEGAKVQVSASEQVVAGLKSQMAAYQALYASATESQRGILAASFATRSQRLSRLTGAEAVGITGLPLGARTAEREAAQKALFSETGASQVFRGGVKGVGGLGGLGFASLASQGFIGAFVGGAALKSVVTAAQNAQAAEALLAQATKTAGAEFQAWKPHIDAAVESLSNMSGFTKDELRGGLVNLVRSTGNVSEALKLQGLAADIARGRNLDYATASLLVSKVVNGNVGLFRRYGVAVQQGATVQEALAAAQQKYAGAAEAYGKTSSGAVDRLHASLQSAEETIGNALLPTITRLSTEFANWIDKMNASGRLQADVNTVMHDTHDAIQAIRFVLIPVSGLFEGLSAAVGGTGNAVKVLVIGWAEWKALNIAGSIFDATTGLFGMATAEEAVGAGAVTMEAEAVPALAAIGTAADTAAASIAGLAGGLAAVGASIPLLLSGDQGGGGAKPQLPTGATNAYTTPYGGNLIYEKSGKWYELSVSTGQSSLLSASELHRIMREKGVHRYQGSAVAGIAAGTPPSGPQGPSTTTGAQAETNLFPGRGNQAGMIDKFLTTNLPPGIQQQLATAVTTQQKLSADENAAAAVQKMLKTKGLLSAAARIEAEKELSKLDREILSLKKQRLSHDSFFAKAQLELAQGNYIAADRILRTDKARLEQELAQATNADERLAITKQLTAVEKALKSKAASWQVPQAMQVAEARADALAVLSGGTTAQQVRIAKEVKSAAMKAIHSHMLTFQGLIDAWRTVQQANSVFVAAAGMAQTYHAISSRAFLSGIEGLTHAQQIALRARYAQQAAHRGYVPVGPAIDGQVIDVHIHSDIDQTVSKIDKHHRRNHQRAGGRR